MSAGGGDFQGSFRGKLSLYIPKIFLTGMRRNLCRRLAQFGFLRGIPAYYCDSHCQTVHGIDVFRLDHERFRRIVNRNNELFNTLFPT